LLSVVIDPGGLRSITGAICMTSSKAIPQPETDLAPQPGPRSHSRPLTVATVLLLVVFQLPIVGWLAPGKGFTALVAGEGVFWAMTLVIIAYVLFVERRPLSSIALSRPTWKGLAIGLAVALVMVGAAALMYLVLFPALGLQLDQASAAMSALQSTPRWFQMLLATRAAVFEEIFYRGFAIE